MVLARDHLQTQTILWECLIVFNRRQPKILDLTPTIVQTVKTNKAMQITTWDRPRLGRELIYTNSNNNLRDRECLARIQTKITKRGCLIIINKSLILEVEMQELDRQLSESVTVNMSQSLKCPLVKSLETQLQRAKQQLISELVSEATSRCLRVLSATGSTFHGFRYQQGKTPAHPEIILFGGMLMAEV